VAFTFSALCHLALFVMLLTCRPPGPFHLAKWLEALWIAALACWLVIGLLFDPCKRLRASQTAGYDVFLSYRVATDRDFVERLYHMLLAASLRVWWDAKALPRGEPWQLGFVDGLFASAVFVPVLSKAGVRPLKQLTCESNCDNLLLELRLALEDNAASTDGTLNCSSARIQASRTAIYPIFLGSFRAELQPPSNKPKHIYARVSPVEISDELPTTPVRAVEDEVNRQLARKKGTDSRSTLDGSPANTFGQLLTFQGHFVDGPIDKALEEAVRQIRNAVAENCLRSDSRNAPLSPAKRKALSTHVQYLRHGRITSLKAVAATTIRGKTVSTESGDQHELAHT